MCASRCRPANWITRSDTGLGSKLATRNLSAVWGLSIPVRRSCVGRPPSGRRQFVGPARPVAPNPAATDQLIEFGRHWLRRGPSARPTANGTTERKLTAALAPPAASSSGPIQTNRDASMSRRHWPLEQSSNNAMCVWACTRRHRQTNCHTDCSAPQNCGIPLEPCDPSRFRRAPATPNQGRDAATGSERGLGARGALFARPECDCLLTITDLAQSVQS